MRGVMKILGRWRPSGKDRNAAPPEATLIVQDNSGAVLASAPQATRADYRITVMLNSGAVLLDLYDHYRRFAAEGGKEVYRTTAYACRTYVKFGECLQDKRAVRVEIRPFHDNRER